MGLVNQPGTTRSVPDFVRILAAIALGAGGALAIVAASARMGSPKSSLLILAILAIPVLAAVTLRPRFGMLLLIFAMCFIEEFPGGIGDTGIGANESERSERTAFYAATLGIPALYIPDAMIGGLLLLYLFKAMLWRDSAKFRLDKIGVALSLLGAMAVLSVVVSLWGAQPFGPPVLDLSTLSVKFPEKNVTDVARYLAVLQYKLYFLLFPSYLLGLFFFREERDVKDMIRVLAIAMVGTILLGSYRLVLDPSAVKNLVPIIFDTASVTLMAMTIFYSRPDRTVIQAVFCALLMLFIMLSFRRTLWGAIAVAALFLPLALPSRSYGRLLLLVCVAVCVALAVLAVAPGGQDVLRSVLARAGETNLDNPSTLYRYALGIFLVERIWDFPLFGYGLTPLWDQTVYFQNWTISMENVHSLYGWILLRMGIVGFLVSCLATVLILLNIREVFRRLDDERDRILVGVIFLSIVIFLFNGIFNPVYATVRLLVPMGFALALVTRLPYIVASRKRQDTTAPAAL
jgi:O-Antigen ligase